MIEHIRKTEWEDLNLFRVGTVRSKSTFCQAERTADLIRTEKKQRAEIGKKNGE